MYFVAAPSGTVTVVVRVLPDGALHVIGCEPAGRSIAAIGVGPRSLPSIVIAHQPFVAPIDKRPEPFAMGPVAFVGSESTLTVGVSVVAEIVVVPAAIVDGEADGSATLSVAPVVVPEDVRSGIVVTTTGGGPECWRVATMAPMPMPPTTSPIATAMSPTG